MGRKNLQVAIVVHEIRALFRLFKPRNNRIKADRIVVYQKGAASIGQSILNPYPRTTHTNLLPTAHTGHAGNSGIGIQWVTNIRK